MKRDQPYNYSAKDLAGFSPQIKPTKVIPTEEDEEKIGFVERINDSLVRVNETTEIMDYNSKVFLNSVFYEDNNTGTLETTDLETQLKLWKKEIKLDRDRYDDVTEFMTKFKDKADL
jgi:hypothetical protein